MLRTDVLNKKEEAAPMKKKKKYKITSKLRFRSFLLISVLSLVLLTTGTVLGLNSLDQSNEPPYQVIEVRSGDTLWALAQKFGPKNQDVRKVVYHICQVNGTSPDQLQPGQNILIPQHL